LRQGEAVVAVLRALVEHFSDRPHLIADHAPAVPRPTDVADSTDVLAGSEEAVRAAVTYVAGMTDRFAFRQAVALLGWDPDKLPAGIDG
jgi:dGTPase